MQPAAATTSQVVDEGHETVPLPVLVPGPALPFVPAGESDPPTARLRAPLDDEREADDGNETAMLLVQPTAPALPFAPAGRRLKRFDPHTGTPLAEPVWVDAEPARPKST
jgi:hypothetical protein